MSDTARHLKVLRELRNGFLRTPEQVDALVAAMQALSAASAHKQSSGNSGQLANNQSQVLEKFEQLNTPASEGDGGRVVASAMSTDAAEHVAFIEACADMLHKLNRTFTARTLRGTAKWVEANTTPPTQQEARS